MKGKLTPDEAEFLRLYRQLSPLSKGLVRRIIDAALQDGDLVSFDESRLKTALERRKARQKARNSRILRAKIVLLIVGFVLLVFALKVAGLLPVLP